MSNQVENIESFHHVLVMRHGQAEVYAQTDDQRSLTESGRKEVIDSGKHISQCLESLNIQRLIILVSKAQRAQQTWHEMQDQLEQLNILDMSIYIQSDLYLANHDHLYHVILEYLVHAEHQSVILLIGHNPGLSNLVNELSASWLSLQTAQWVHLTSNKDLARWTVL